MGTIPNLRSGLKREGFFEKNRQISSSKEWFYVGGKSDNAFRAFAAALIDHLISGRRVYNETLTRLLDSHYYFFPHHRSSLIGLQTSTERAQRLLIEVEMPELLQSIAYTLRQLAVDELLHSPEKYRGAFRNRYDAYEPQMMRGQAIQLDKSALAALAYALNMPVLLQVIDNAKALPLRLHYNSQAERPEIMLKLQDEVYFPKLRNVKRFRNVALNEVEIDPVKYKKRDPELQDVLAKITADDQAIYEEYVVTNNRLSAMVNAGELTKDDLLNIYTQSFSSADSDNQGKYIGTEHGSEKFFATIMRSLGHSNPATAPLAQKNYVENELIQTIARNLSCKTTKIDAFEHIDNLNFLSTTRLTG